MTTKFLKYELFLLLFNAQFSPTYICYNSIYKFYQKSNFFNFVEINTK